MEEAQQERRELLKAMRLLQEEKQQLQEEQRRLAREREQERETCCLLRTHNQVRVTAYTMCQYRRTNSCIMSPVVIIFLAEQLLVTREQSNSLKTMGN